MAKTAAERKQKSRADKKKKGFRNINLSLHDNEIANLDRNRKCRSRDEKEYTREEYIARLIDLDTKRIEEVIKEVSSQPCDKCKDPLPEGCGGLFRGDNGCFRTHGDKLFLL